MSQVEALVVGLIIPTVIVVGALLLFRYVNVSGALRYFGVRLLELLRPFIPHLSLLCIVVGIIIAVAGVIFCRRLAAGNELEVRLFFGQGPLG